MKRSLFKFDMAAINKLKKNLGARPEVQVGVFEGKSGRTDGPLTNADLAKIHEYGAPEHGLPARSMLKEPISDHAAEIMAPFKGKADAYVRGGGQLEDLWKQIGIACEAVVAGAFKTGGYGKWAPLAYSTLLRKLNRGKRGRSLAKRKSLIGQIYAGQVGSAILIYTGELRRSFSSRVRMRFT